ncbi:MAG: diphthine--ammonia ligase [Methanobacteriota archaeon]
MKVSVLYSGGKDSNYALYWALNQGWDVDSLVSLKPKREDSYMFHYPCIDLTNLQASCIGLPLLEENVSGVKEEEVSELETVLSKLDVDGIVSGAVASEYQKTRIDSVCHNLELKSFNPLWHKEPVMLMRDILGAGFKVLVVGVSAEGLDESWLGRLLSEKDVMALVKLEEKYGVSVCGEGGEFETFVLDGPTFKKKIKVKQSVKKWEGQSGILSILEAEIQSKINSFSKDTS